MILGLTAHYPRVGKDTCADFLKTHYRFYKDFFAKGIYDEVAAAFGVTVEQLGSNEWKTQPQPELVLGRCADPEFVKAIVGNSMPEPVDLYAFLQEPRTSRFILQQWGTEYRRRQDQDYWVKDLKERVDEVILHSDQSIVVSDVREDHECAYLYELAVTTGQKLAIIEVLRPSMEAGRSNHSSDAGISRKYITTTIENVEGHPEIMLATLVKIVEELRSKS